MKNLTLYFLSLMILAISSCNCQATKELKGIGRFDVSSSQIAFEYWNSGTSAIYFSDLEGLNTKKLLSSKDTSYLSPSFSSDGKKIVYVKNPKNHIRSVLCIANADGSDRAELTNGQGIITEAIFSSDEKQIYFLKAETYKSHSPIANSDFHDMDIYSVDIKSKQINKI